MNCAMTAFEPHGLWGLALSHLQHGSCEIMIGDGAKHLHSVPRALLILFGFRGKRVLPCP